MNESQEGWTKRHVTYEQIHKVKPEQFRNLIDALEVADGQLIGDFMAGYGAVTRELCKYISNHNIKGVGIIMVERFREQLSRADQLKGLVDKINKTAVIHKNSDVRSINVNGSQFDSIAMKMGLHEIPQEDQQQVINEAYRLLKPNGILALWDVYLQTEEEQTAFRAAIRKKDELAGFETLARQRYFYRKGELTSKLAHAGFSPPETIFEWDYSMSTADRLASEFGSDRGKLNAWNDYLRNNVCPKLPSTVKFEDNGDDIVITWRKMIVRARKD